MNTITITLALCIFALCPVKMTLCMEEEKRPNLYAHESQKYYSYNRKIFFNAIKECDIQLCKKLLKLNNDLVHTKCEFGDENITLDFYPLPYLVSLEGQKNNSVSEYQKEKIIDMFMKQITSPEVLYDSFSYILNYMSTEYFIVTKTTYAIIEQILNKIAKIQILQGYKNSSQDEVLKDYELKQSRDITRFCTSFKKNKEKTNLEKKLIQIFQHFLKKQQENFLKIKYPKKITFSYKTLDFSDTTWQNC